MRPGDTGESPNIEHRLDSDLWIMVRRFSEEKVTRWIPASRASRITTCEGDYRHPKNSLLLLPFFRQAERLSRLTVTGWIPEQGLACQQQPPNEQRRGLGES